jgi:hypothetical protein
MTDLENPSEKSRNDKESSRADERESSKSDQLGPSADFAALIDAITAEGRAYRKEEQREDRGKKFREWITIVLIALTFGAVSLQVHEMIKVYEPIREQAKAATDQAAAATIQAETEKRSAKDSH